MEDRTRCWGFYT